MRVVASILPGLGHLNPMVPLLRALAARGNEVEVVVPPSFVGFVEAVGLPVVGVGSAWTEMGIEDLVPGWHDFDAPQQAKVWIDFATTYAPDLLAHIEARGADVIVHDHYEFAAWMVGERLGIPNVPYAMTARFLDPALIAMLGLQDEYDAMARSFDLPPDAGEGRAIRWLYLDALPPSLLADLLPPGPTVRAVSHLADDSTGGGDVPSWLGERDRSRPLVYVTLGTIFNQRRDVIAALVDGVARLDVDVLLTVGHDGRPPDRVPANVHVEHYVPQAAIYDSVAAVVCHGGFGTVFGSLGHGVPVVCAPISADQPLNATVVAMRGIGANLATVVAEGSIFAALQPGQPDPDLVAGTVGRVLAEPSFREQAGIVADAMRAQATPDEAAAMVEDVVAGR